MSIRQIPAAVVALALLCAPFDSQAAHSGCGAHAATKVADVMLVRPVSLAVTLASTGLWTGLSPYLALIGVADSWGHAMVVEPWQFTGGRFAGCFSGPDAYQP